MTTTTTPELVIEPKLPVLAFNFDQLKAWAIALAEHYASLVVTEDAIADARRDMAELNRAKKAVDDARKETVRRVSEPIRAFETQIKEVCGIFDAAYSKLAGQVKAFEDAQREEKRKVVQEIILEEVSTAYGADSPRPAIPVQDTWLNKSTSLKTVREAVKAIIEKNLEDECRRKALEQARQDRIAAIETHVRVLNQGEGCDLSVALFMGDSFLDPSIPLADVLKRIGHIFSREVEKRDQLAKQAQNPAFASQSPVSVPITEDAVAVKHAPAQTRAMSIVLEYDIANEEQVKSCLENLKRLCINYGARYR